VDPDQPTRQYRVVRRIEEPDDVFSLVLEPVDGGALPAIAPGQYVSVFVDLPDGARQPRQYRCPQPPYEPGCRSLCQLILLRLDQATTVVQCIGLDAGNNDHLAAMKM
jgi:ferredoxin-NADP reductase